MRIFKISKNNGICGVSDGLTLPCSICGKENIKGNYLVTDEFWESIVPKEIKRDVICLPCLEKIAEKHDKNLAENIIQVQYTGEDFTVEFFPSNVFHYNKKKKIKGE